MLTHNFAFYRVFGAIIIVLGLYLVIWSTNKDKDLSSKSNNIDQIAPIDQYLPDKNLTMKSSNDEESDATEANVAGDSAV